MMDLKKNYIYIVQFQLELFNEYNKIINLILFLNVYI